MRLSCFHKEHSAHICCFTWFPWCRFYFDFSPTYVGCGLICPHIVNCSVLLGAIISWGFLWPFISQHAGDWYPADLNSNDFKGLYGYKVWCENSHLYYIVWFLHTNHRILGGIFYFLWLASWCMPLRKWARGYSREANATGGGCKAHSIAILLSLLSSYDCFKVVLPACHVACRSS